jgi:DNA processing protein
MAFTIPDIELDRIAELVVAGKSHRDAWLPIVGKRKSGFSNPEGSVDLANLEMPTNAPEMLNEVRRDVRALLRDPSVRIIVADSIYYPRRLSDLDGHPAVLFVRGDFCESSESTLAIVGSRAASEAGLRAAQLVAGVAAEMGHVIVSGLALGIDSAGHLGALNAGGQTIAVMGTGLGQLSPIQHQELAHRIVQQGALLTQFPPKHPPTKTTFPARNVLIAGLSDVSLVIEMNERSGTRIEADCAIAQGKRVLLWAPILEPHDWARKIAEHPQVAFVETEEEVLIELAAQS